MFKFSEKRSDTEPELKDVSNDSEANLPPLPAEYQLQRQMKNRHIAMIRSAAALLARESSSDFLSSMQYRR